MEEFDETQIKHTSINMELIKKNVPSYSNEKLCEMIVCDRYFSMGKEISIICMEELGKRRETGDTFNFEEYIDKSFKELPELNFEMPDLRSILNQVIKNKSK
jgi:hypothetical protein